MKKQLIFGAFLCATLLITSCGTSESAYKKAYEKAKRQDQGSIQEREPMVDLVDVSTPVQKTTTPTRTTTISDSDSQVTSERVTVVSGKDALKEYSVVCGSFGIKANAEGLRQYMIEEGYDAVIAYNDNKAMFRVIVSTFNNKADAVNSRNSLKQRYPSRQDFKGSWVLYRTF